MASEELSTGSISEWIAGAKRGSDVAVQRLWQRYFERLVYLARRKLEGAPRRAADEEDVALSAFNAFCQAARQGRFPNLNDRYDLWRLLMKITAEKAIDQVRYEKRQQRGAGKVLTESAFDAAEASGQAGGIAQVVGSEPTPEFAVMVAENCQRLLEQLGDNDLRAIALSKLEGCTNREIAERLGCALRTVERRLQLVREKWEQEVP